MLRGMDWIAAYESAAARYRDGELRLGSPDDPDPRQRQLTRLGNVAWAAGLFLLMAGRGDESAEWLRRAVARYGESWVEAPPSSWGRPIAMQKALLVAGDDASEAARAALEAGAAEAESPIGRYAGTLALLVLGRDGEAGALAATLVGRDAFPLDVAAALAALAAGAGAAYAEAAESILRSFETRDEFLEDAAVADTLLALQRLAAARGLAVQLRSSPVLP